MSNQPTPIKTFITSSKETKTPSKEKSKDSKGFINYSHLLGLDFPDSEKDVSQKKDDEEEHENYYFNYIEQFEDEDFDPYDFFKSHNF